MRRAVIRRRQNALLIISKHTRASLATPTSSRRLPSRHRLIRTVCLVRPELADKRKGVLMKPVRSRRQEARDGDQAPRPPRLAQPPVEQSMRLPRVYSALQTRISLLSNNHQLTRLNDAN